MNTGGFPFVIAVIEIAFQAVLRAQLDLFIGLSLFF